jgi:hypothetical protein
MSTNPITEALDRSRAEMAQGTGAQIDNQLAKARARREAATAKAETAIASAYRRALESRLPHGDAA